MLRTYIAKIILFCLFFQFLGVPVYTQVWAVDADGTFNLDLNLWVTTAASSIVGDNFSLNFTITNQISSEWDGFNPWFVVLLPEDITFENGWSLGSPERTVSLADGRTLLVFETTELLIQGNSLSYSIQVSSETTVDLFTPTSLEVLGFAWDSIYGRWTVPSGSPSWTKPGWVDVTNGGTDPVDLAFPDNVTSVADLSGLVFTSASTQFVPFDVTKSSPWDMLVGDTGITTLTISWNDLWPLSDFRIIDVIPNTRKFVWFIDDSVVWSGSVLYDTPTPWQVTLDLSDIDVPTWTDAIITYTTQALAYEAASYSWASVVLNTWAPIADNTASTNTATMQPEGTWNDGVTNISINSWSVIPPRNATATISYAEMSKWVNNSSPVIGDVIRYTISYTVANNVAYDTTWSGTYILDELPDGLSFSGTVTTTNNGTWSTLGFVSSDTDLDWDTVTRWELSSWTINAGETITVVYDVLVDGLYEWAWDANYENTQAITNTVTLYGTIADSGNNEEWWFTNPSLIGTVDTETASAGITAPEPTSGKQLISIEFPDATVYNSSNPLPAWEPIPVGAEMTFAVNMWFPNVISTWAILKDALPLLTWPNDDITDIAFQTNTSLEDINGVSVPFNDDDGNGTADTSFNGNILGGTTPADSAWITTSAPNNIEFALWGGSSAKTFSLIFTTQVLPAKPSGFTNQPELPQKNVLIWSFWNDAGASNALGVIDAPFTIGLPVVWVTKTSTWTEISYGKNIPYQIIFSNTWKWIGFLENIIDTLPDNLTLVSSNFTYSGWTVVPNSSMTQSGSTLLVNFNTGATYPGRSALWLDDDGTPWIDESVVILDYVVTPTQDFIIVWWDARENTIVFDYYSDGDNPSDDVNRFGSPEAMTTFEVDTPSIVRTLISTSETWSLSNDLQKWETAEFETVITLPGWTYTNASFRDDLSTVLSFLSWSVVDYDSEIIFGTWVTISTGATYTGSSIVNFWDMINTSTTDKTITIRSTVRANNSWGNFTNRKSEWDFIYSAQTISDNEPVDVVRPSLNITKTVNPSSADSDDTLTYTLWVVHLWWSRADAYDIVLTDTLPANISYVPGTLTGSSYIGLESDLFSGTWLIFERLPDDGSSLSLSFDAIIWSWAVAGSMETNSANITYDSLAEDDSPFEQNRSDSVTRDIMLEDASITHSITNTNNSDTLSNQFSALNPDVAIWEEIIYTTLVDLPKLNFAWFTFTQSLPSWVEFLSGAVITDWVVSHSPETITISPDNVVTFNFWNIQNTGSWSWTWFVLETTAALKDIVTNSAGDVVGSTWALAYDGTNSKTDTTPNFDIVEPNISISKVFATGAWDAGDSILTTITIENTGTSPAYDVSWWDTLPPKTTWWAWYLASSSTGTLNPWDSYSYTYNTELWTGVIYGEVLTGSGTITVSSWSGAVADERSYSWSTTADITITWITWLTKMLTSSWTSTIWDRDSFSITLPIPEWTTSSIILDDLVPAWLEILSGSINISTSPWVSYSWTVVPTIWVVSIWNTQSISYSFTWITNSDTNNAVWEFITITYDTVVLNTGDNNLWDIKSEDASANYNSGTTTLTATPANIVISEPSVSAAIVSSYTFGNTVVYTYTLTNTGTSTAYDLDLDTTLPPWLTFSWAYTLTNTWWALGIVQVWDDFTISSLDVNTGSPLQFTIEWIIDWTVSDMESLLASVTGEYTSSSWSYLSLVWNTDNTQRTWNGSGENDYAFSDSDSFTVLLPILQQSISVNDLNGWPGIREDIFEYTVTLTNTWSVDLTDIAANIDIPLGFTGFTVTSIPSWSTDNSTATGWINSAWELLIEWIDILIGQTVTIVYQVQAADDVVSNTTITTNSIITDSPEGAIWWISSSDVVILASGIRLTKVVSSTSFNNPVQINDTVSYGLVIENIGDTTLTWVTLTDALLWGDITASCSFPWVAWTLNPSQTGSCSPGDYLVTSTDILNWYIQNSASVSSSDASANSVFDTSDAWDESIETLDGTGSWDLDTTNDPTVQTLIQEPKLSLIKVVSGTWFSTPNKIWDTVSYNLTIRNTWNLTITWITLEDTLLGWDITSSCIFPISAGSWLLVWESATCTPSSYSMIDLDLRNWYVENTATVSWYDILWVYLEDISDAWDESIETLWATWWSDGLSDNDPTIVTFPKKTWWSWWWPSWTRISRDPNVNSSDLRNGNENENENSSSLDFDESEDNWEDSENNLWDGEEGQNENPNEWWENTNLENEENTSLPNDSLGEDSNQNENQQQKQEYTPRTYDSEPKIASCWLSVVTFSDIEQHTFREYIIDMERISGLNGNGSWKEFNIFRKKSAIFEPDRFTTRSEFIKMIFRALCIDYTDENNFLNDFSDSWLDDWQAKVVNKAVKLWWISASNDMFQPNEPISRREAIKIILKAWVANELPPVWSRSFVDVDYTSWEAQYIESGYSYGIINGQVIANTLKFRPNDSILRWETTKLIMNTIVNNR